MLEATALDRIYADYGFEKKSTRHPDVALYVLRTGHFLNVDIVPLSQDANTSEVFGELSSAGFACQVRRYSSLSDVAETLFRGFFASDSTRKRLEQDYARFCEQQSRQLAGRYQYVPCHYKLLTDGCGCVDPEPPLVDMVTDILLRPGPQLVVLEAAAGYGKTCTAYEILRSFLARPEVRCPIFTELSRNRTARIFRYVLLDEIDRNFYSLKSDLVVREIETGRLPLIVDGFDELLHREQAGEQRFEETESMLATIGELLKGHAKVLLTSRKTAIFDGDAFHQWMDQRASAFHVTRIAISEPEVVDWLGRDRLRMLEEAAVPVRSLANPVLLTFLRNLEDAEFARSSGDTDTISEKYFTSLLDREVVRQNLLLDVAAQKAIFVQLATFMAENDITSESREFLRDVILSYSKEALTAARLVYPVPERPTVEELADKLAGHALLDRVGRSKSSVGFVNDFVFGTLLADALTQRSDDEWTVAEQFIDLTVTATRIRGSHRRNCIWTKLGFALSIIDTPKAFVADMDLMQKPKRTYSNATIEGAGVADCAIDVDAFFDNCVFANCMFERVVFSRSRMSNVGFLNCRFYQCSISDEDGVDDPGGRWALGCPCETPDEQAFLDLLTETVGPGAAAVMGGRDYETDVLEKFWPRGRPHATTRRQLRTLFQGFGPNDRQHVSDAISSLRRQGLINVWADGAELVIEQMDVIRQRLGR